MAKNINRILLAIFTILIILSCEGLENIRNLDTQKNDSGYYGDVESVTTLYYSFESSDESKDSIKTHCCRSVENYDINGKPVSSISFSIISGLLLW